MQEIAKKTKLSELRRLGVVILCNDIESRGSGFILRKDGLIATNWHVVHDKNSGIRSNSIAVLFYDGTSESTQIIRCDKEKDFAVLKIDKEFEFSPEFNSYEDVEPYESVFFAGKGLDVPTVSFHKGWISAKTRKDELNIFQIDGPINQGNSGGPVFSKDGKLIGIITQTEARFSGELLELMDYLKQVQRSGSITMLGVNPLEVFRQMIFWLNRNRNVGIGYAFSIDYIKSTLDEL